MPLSLGQFFRATIFLCRFFFNSPMPFLGRYLHFLLYIICISPKSLTVFWAQNEVRTEIKIRFKICMIRTKFSLISIGIHFQNIDTGLAFIQVAIIG